MWSLSNFPHKLTPNGVKSIYRDTSRLNKSLEFPSSKPQLQNFISYKLKNNNKLGHEEKLKQIHNLMEFIDYREGMEKYTVRMIFDFLAIFIYIPPEPLN